MDSLTMEDKGDFQVEVYFWTKINDPRLQAPEGSFMIESKSGRAELSELLNALLKTESHITFDFIIEEVFLRGTVYDYMRQSGKTSESKLKIEYLRTLSKPSLKVLDKQKDWIRSIAGGIETDNPMVVVGFYDGRIRFYNTVSHGKGKKVKLEEEDKNKEAFEFNVNELLPSGDSTSIFRVQSQQLNDSEFSKVWASTMSGSIVGLNYSAKTQECILKNVKLRASLAPIEALCPVKGCDSIILAGDANGNVLVFCENDGIEDDSSNIQNIGSLNCIAKIRSHSSNVTDILSMGDHLISSSLDGNIKVLKVSLGEAICGWNIKFPTFSLSSQNPIAGNVICTSHDDGKVRIWDLRAGTTNQIDLKINKGLDSLSFDRNTRFIHRSRLLAHKEVVPQAVWNPFSEYMIGSVSHDMDLKILDIRSPNLPLQAAKTDSKLLSLCWLNEHTIYTGGSTGELIVSSF
ncbi:microtubule-associated protein [Cryptosporidium ubiquitum]|uniref:Microtubule-associated protein n=1 Tax=Cryptosporidium ubiquitum TaxID=857276 RepID=A0A1J4MG53_9CRYT|nr:microtubule-associated protein [Cryptosporidium ubiquitum]OII73234.1 microtubule-associated protein [Cryptosporidium ubiquitum]